MSDDEFCAYCAGYTPCRRASCVLEAKAEAMYPQLRNRAMARALASGKCIDLDEAGILVEGTNERPILYQLPVFLGLGVDYCHVPTESWVWSIGREVKSPGRVLVAFDGRFYSSAMYECLWLR